VIILVATSKGQIRHLSILMSKSKQLGGPREVLAIAF